MGELKITTKIPLPDEVTDALDELDIFYRTNRYEVHETEEEGTRRYTRGESGKGFWTSDLTVLPTEVIVTFNDAFAIAAYTINTTGQLLSEDEKGFWGREALAAAQFLETGQPPNLVDEERDRAEKVRGETMRRGCIWGTLIGLALFVLLMFFYTQI